MVHSLRSLPTASTTRSSRAGASRFPFARHMLRSTKPCPESTAPGVAKGATRTFGLRPASGGRRTRRVA
eukprot:2973083-Alexandrium_andersonii.AAC.1